MKTSTPWPPELPWSDPVCTSDVLNAYDAFQGDDVGDFTFAWDDYLAGRDKPCAWTADGLHDTSAGSCDMCGRKNYNDD
jgi:hypothetical protein